MYAIIKIDTASENALGGIFGMFGSANKTHGLTLMSGKLYENIEDAEKWVDDYKEENLIAEAKKLIDNKVKYSNLYGDIGDLKDDDALAVSNLMVLEVPIFKTLSVTKADIAKYIEDITKGVSDE